MINNIFFTIGNNSFPYSKDLFGQISRVITFIHESDQFKFSSNDTVNMYLLSQSPDVYNIHENLPENIKYIQTNSPIDDDNAYASVINPILENENSQNFVISMFIDREQAGIWGLKSLKKKYPTRLLISIGLFCTAHEYFNTISDTELEASKKNLEAYEYNLRKNSIAERMYKYIELYEKSGIIDSYIVNSKLTYESYATNNFFKGLNADKKLTLLSSGIDRKIYHTIDTESKQRIKKTLNIDKPIVLFANRFTQYKGSEIISQLLDDPKLKHVTFLFPFYFGQNNSRFLEHLEKNKPHNLSNIKFYLDISKHISFNQQNIINNIYASVKTSIDESINSLSAKQQQLIKKLGGVSIISTSIFAISDVFIRPSIWDSQPVSVLESLASGCPCLISDRIGIPFHYPDNLVIKYPDSIQMRSKYSQNSSPIYDETIKNIAGQFRDKILQILNGKITYNQLNNVTLNYLSSQNMARRYSNHLQSLRDHAYLNHKSYQHSPDQPHYSEYISS